MEEEGGDRPMGLGFPHSKSLEFPFLRLILSSGFGSMSLTNVNASFNTRLTSSEGDLGTVRKEDDKDVEEERFTCM